MVNKRTSSLLASLFLVGLTQVASTQTLVGFAALPADTFAPGPTSGNLISPANGRTPPFNGQPVQGFSAVLNNHDGTYSVMADNGFGAIGNSADFLLRFYNVTPDFRTASGGAGGLQVNSWTTLRDPDHHIGWEITADKAFYPNGISTLSSIPVDSSIKANRWLTGFDFDLESFRRTPDGSYWFGEEFGPYLIKTDATGKVLRAPIAMPGVNAPQNKLGNPSNLAGSKGFEGMALNYNGTKLFTLLEGPVAGDPTDTLRINEFDLASESYTGKQWIYKMESSANAIGDFTAINQNEYLIIERDNGQGATAQFKKIFKVKLNADGTTTKTLLVDLMNVADPNDLNQDGSTLFTFPFVTIEDVLIKDAQTLMVINDNNYPFSVGRSLTGQPDNEEFILIGLDKPLDVVSIEVTPEPGTVGFLAASLLSGIAFLRRRVRARR